MLLPVAADKTVALRHQKVACPCSLANPRPAYTPAAHGGTFRINSNIVLSSSLPHSSTEAQWVPQFQLAANDSAVRNSGWLQPAVSCVTDTMQAIMDAIHTACTSAISCVYDWVLAIVRVCLVRLGLHSRAQQQPVQAVSPVAEQSSSVAMTSQPEHAMPANCMSFPNGSYARLLQQRCASVQQAATSLPLYTTIGSVPVGYRGSILAAALLVVLLPSGLIAHQREQRRRQEQEALRAVNASSLNRQKKRMAAALAFDAINVELPTIAGAEVDPNTLPVEAVATSLIEAEFVPGSSDSFLSMEASMRSEWEQFTAASKVRLVRDLWDARSAAAEEAELAPRASREQLEEMSRRIKNANKNADGSEIVDPPASLDGEGGEAMEHSGITWGDSSLQGSGASSISSSSSSSVLGDDWEAGLAERAARRRARFAAAAGGRDQPSLHPAAEVPPAMQDQLISTEQYVAVDAPAAHEHGSLSSPKAADRPAYARYRRLRSPSSDAPAALREKQGSQQQLHTSQPV